MDYHVGSGGGGTLNMSMGPQVSQFPRNFSVTSTTSSRESNDQDDLTADLIRVVSTRRGAAFRDNLAGGKVQVSTDGSRKIQPISISTSTPISTGGVGQRSYSVGIGLMGKIDENEACSFEEGDITNVGRRRFSSRCTKSVKTRNKSVNNVISWNNTICPKPAIYDQIDR